MSTSEADIDCRIGDRIRELRTEKDLSLDVLAGQANVSRAMLSRIERGESSPTAQMLNKICNGLGVTLARLFAEAGTPANSLSRRSDQPTWRDPASRYLRRNVSPAGTGSPVEIVEVEFPAGGQVAFDSQRLAGWDQHVWVLDGTLELELGDEAFRLHSGDCLMMHFDRPVLFRNSTGSPIRYAVIISHPAER